MLWFYGKTSLVNLVIVDEWIECLSNQTKERDKWIEKTSPQSSPTRKCEGGAMWRVVMCEQSRRMRWWTLFVSCVDDREFNSNTNSSPALVPVNSRQLGISIKHKAKLGISPVASIFREVDSIHRELKGCLHDNQTKESKRSCTDRVECIAQNAHSLRQSTHRDLQSTGPSWFQKAPWKRSQTHCIESDGFRIHRALRIVTNNIETMLSNVFAYLFVEWILYCLCNTCSALHGSNNTALARRVSHWQEPKWV